MLFLVLAALLLPAALIALVARRAGGLPGGAETVQGYLTAVAILVAAMWYFTERKGSPHADIQLEVSGARIDPDQALVTVEVRTKNLGHTLLRTREWDVRLQRLVPSSVPIDALTALSREEWPEKKDGRELYWDHQIRWQSFREFRGIDKRVTEPDEVDVKIFDFIVPCSISAARISVSLRKPDPGWWGSRSGNADSPSEANAPPPGPEAANDARADDGADPSPLWWQDQALLSLRALCRKPPGSVAQLHPLPI